jgi:LmbE family N-acetylglucosaminyl deacetylase
VIGCGGSIVKHVDQGSRVRVVIVVERDRSLESTRSDAELAQEIADACAALGVEEFVHLQEPARGLAGSRALRVELVRLYRAFRPQVLYVPHADDGDLEHRLVHELAIEAMWLAGERYFPEAGPEIAPPPNLVLGYEVWALLPSVDYAEEIGGALDRKVEAMERYRSQVADVDWPAAIRGLAAYRGALAFGAGFAEAFSVVHMRGLDPAALTRALA